MAKAAHSLSAEALGLDEFETLSREKAYLADAFGVPVEIISADAVGGEPQGQEMPSGAEDPCNILLNEQECYFPALVSSLATTNLLWQVIYEKCQ